MKIGILSDTHGKAAMMASAVRLLRGGGAEYVIHCGDVGEVRLLDHLTAGPAAFVLGNNDWEEQEYRSYAQSLGILFFGHFGELELDGKRLAVMHGDDFRLRQEGVIDEQKHDYLLLGHSHVRAGSSPRAGAQLVNPGALFRQPRRRPWRF